MYHFAACIAFFLLSSYLVVFLLFLATLFVYSTGDTCGTFVVGETDEAGHRLIRTTIECLDLAIDICGPGVRCVKGSGVFGVGVGGVERDSLELGLGMLRETERQIV